MSMLQSWVFVLTALLPPLACAADLAVASFVEGNPRVLRGATWYKLVPWARLEDGDILSVDERGQVLAEFAGGTAFSFVGPGTLYLDPKSGMGAPSGTPQTITVPGGWLKLVARPPGVRLRLAAVEVAAAEGILVMHAQGSMVELFVESGTARLAALLPNGKAGPPREAKQGEHWSSTDAGGFVTVARAPKPFVETIPRRFLDPLPGPAAKTTTKPTLVADGDVTYAEAAPWLGSRDGAAFEKRFAVRLRDPAFRNAAEPQIARYRSWDRMLHPEKYAPRPTAVQ
jgi:hypothetical protein